MKPTCLSWTPGGMGTSISVLMLLCDKDTLVPKDFLLDPVLGGHWHDIRDRLRSYRPDKFWLGWHEPHDDPDISVVATSRYKFIPFLLTSRKQEVTPWRNGGIHEIRSVSLDTVCVLSLNLSTYKVVLETFKGTIFDIYDFLLDPIPYFRRFLLSREIVPNGKTDEYVNLLYECNKEYFLEIQFIISVINDAMIGKNRIINLTVQQQLFVMLEIILATNKRFEYKLNIPFRNTNEIMSYLI